MATTAAGTPYVESSDLVANYPGVSLSLANHIDGLDGGKVLQVVAGVTTTSTATSSTSFVDTTLTATITPSDATSTIMVLVSQNGMQRRTGGGINVELYRDATMVARLVGYGGNTNTNLVNNFGSVSGNYVDSPATTSAIIYKTQFKSETGTAQTINAYGAYSSIVLMEVSA